LGSYPRQESSILSSPTKNYYEKTFRRNYKWKTSYFSNL
jgi:hypothetical protein